MEDTMAKIGIITLNGYFNYGNRLQNYALQEMLKDLGFEVETIINDSLQIRSEGKRKIERIKGKSFKELYLTSIKMVENFLYKNKLDRQRSQIFRDFSRMYLSETN